METSIKNRDHWQQVWQSFRSGNADSFREIYNEFADALFTYGSKITPDRELLKDCIQDLFIDLYRYNLELRCPEYLEFYLYKTLKHLLIRKIRLGRQLQHLPAEDFTVFNLNFNFEEDYFQQESEMKRQESVKRILQNLDDTKRELIFLKFTSGLNYAEIGEILNLKPDTVKKQLYRLLQSLRENYSVKLMELFLMCCKA